MPPISSETSIEEFDDPGEPPAQQREQTPSASKYEIPSLFRIEKDIRTFQDPDTGSGVGFGSIDPSRSGSNLDSDTGTYRKSPKFGHFLNFNHFF